LFGAHIKSQWRVKRVARFVTVNHNIMIFYSNSFDNSLLKSHGKPFDDLESYGANLYVSPFALKPMSFDMMQSQIASGAKLIYVITDIGLFDYERFLKQLDTMKRLKGRSSQFVAIVIESSDNMVYCHDLMYDWNERGGTSYFVPNTNDLYLYLQRFEKELNRMAIDGRMTLLSLPHVTSEIADRLIEYGLGNAIQLLTVSTTNTTNRLSELTGLNAKQIGDIRKWFQLEDGYEMSVYRPNGNELAIRDDHDAFYNDFVQFANENGGVVR
jgi:hypothetical protein